MKSPDQAAFRVIMIVSVIIALAMLPFAARAGANPRHGPPAFSEIDENGDGYVSEEELASFRAARMAAMAEAGRPMKGAATAPSFSDLDTDGDGMLSEAELKAGQQAHTKAMRQKHGMGRNRPTFSDLDLDGDGCIDAEEFDKHVAERHGRSHGKDH